MDRTQLYTSFDVAMARKILSSVMKDSNNPIYFSLKGLARIQSDQVISSRGFIDGWDLFECCIVSIILALGIPHSRVLATCITDAMAEEIDLSDFIFSDQHELLLEIFEYAGLAPCDNPAFFELFDRVSNLVRTWGAYVPGSESERSRTWSYEPQEGVFGLIRG